jgi:hypothetical protein
MKTFAILVLAVLLINITGCAGMSDTAQRSMTGGLGGAAGGAVIGAIAGNAGMGALIGSAVGASGGFLYGKHKEAEQRAYQQGRRDAQSSR